MFKIPVVSYGIKLLDELNSLLLGCVLFVKTGWVDVQKLVCILGFVEIEVV